MKYAIRLIVVIATMLSGLVLVAPAANANSIEIESTTYTETSANAEVKSETRAVINGATQVTWEEANHKVKITKKQVRKAPKLKVKATGANSSKVIAKKAKGAKIVVLKKGSCVRNTGRENQLRVGFVWCLKHDAVLVFDSASRQYRHSHNIVGGKLIKSCLNYIGGKLPMRKKVVQVRYESDVLLDIALESAVSVTASVKASLECPTGKLEGEASASASGTASASIRVKTGVKIAAINAKKAEIIEKARAEAQTKAKANATAKIKLTCSDAPPPANKKPAARIDGSAAHVEAGKKVEVFGMTRDEDGDVLDVKVTATPKSLGWIAGWRKVATGQNGQPCEQGWTCWQGTLWTNDQPSWSDGHQEFVTVRITATDPSGEVGEDEVLIPVRKVEHPDT